MLEIEQIEQILKKEDLKVLKNLGQNFLTDEEALRNIVSSSSLSEDDTVLEVGPGMGVLTFALSEKCKKVFAIEKDRKMAKLLKKEINSKGDKYKNIEIFCDDILKINLPLFLEKNNIKEYKLVANIPYYITSSITKLFLETDNKPKTMVLLMQKEVAERICAKKGNLSVLALSVLLYGNPEMVGVVGRKSFYPAPKVDSAILRITNIEEKFSKEDYKKIFRVIKIGFSSKRKKLVNNLSAGFKLDKQDVEKILENNQIDICARAQDLNLDDWVRIKDSF